MVAAANVINMFDRLRTLKVPVPPNLERVVGYRGNCRYVAFYWIPGGDEIIYNDGCCSGTGDAFGWLAFAQHDIIRPFLRDVDYGSSDEDAEEWLVLDRTERNFKHGQPKAAQLFLAKQHPEPSNEVVYLSEEDLDRLRDEFEEATRITSVQAFQLTLSALHEKSIMLRWLDELKKQVLES